jgi:LmbE family N-acetylglucosaminyl deacetylase
VSVLVVVAHSDDESFWMGGTIARLSKTDRVVVAALSDGVGSRFPSLEGYDEARQRRHRAFLRACGILKAECVQMDVFPDQQADTVPQLVINRAVQSLVDDYQPATVYTHHVGDLNIDHRRTAEAVFVAIRGMVCRAYAMRPEWPELCVGQDWRPSCESIDGFLETKLLACRCYAGEMREPPHPRSEAAIIGRDECFMRVQ